MKIALAATRPPYPLNSGGRIRTFHLLKELCAANDVTFVTSVDGSAEHAALADLGRAIPGLDVRTVRAPSRRGFTALRARMLLNAFDPVPYTWVPYRTGDFHATVQRLVREHCFDVVHCDHVQLAYAFEGLAAPARVLNAHNIEYQILRRAADEEKRAARRWLFAWQAAKVRRAEARAFRGFDRAVAVSTVDRAEIERLAPGTTVSVVPNGVDVEAFAPVECRQQAGRMVFAGAMDWLPNADAAAFFVERIFPGIRARSPSAHVRLVGRNPDPALVRRLSGPGVEFTGTVADVRPEVAAAALVVVPLRIGSGTRLKILEAWAMGKAVLSTSVGAEGLPAVDGENIALADGAEAFTQRAVELLDDRATTTALGISGRRVALARFSWKQITRDLVAAYEDAVVAHREHARVDRVP